jgi:hypothetical protein
MGPTFSGVSSRRKTSGGRDDLDRAAQRLQPVPDQDGDAFHAFYVLAARLDADQVAHGVQHGLLLALGGLVDGGNRGGQRGVGAAQEGQGDAGAKNMQAGRCVRHQ